ncbi:hypothetical protein X546_19005 [Brevibacillus borstelensis cifa_chp40]|jgi:hypothetical protein|nr:hypothetical protein X546_19005 [Brevibacillus borstelensis cifa_chp40]
MHPKIGESGIEGITGFRPIQRVPLDIYLYCKKTVGIHGARLRQQGGTNVRGFFANHEGFEVVIWILVIIFLLSIFFDEGID